MALQRSPLIAVALSILTISCSREAAAPATDQAVDTPPPSVIPAPPAHHWITKEGQEYGYAIALTPEDQMAGRGASEVLMVRFLGVTDGTYKIATLSGTTYFVMSCSNPCSVVKTFANADEGAFTKRATFNPDTVMGQAFTDAFNGQLEVYGSDSATR